MKIRVGDSICSEYGDGKVVAITEEFIVYRIDDKDDRMWHGHEVALSLEDDHFWFPDECFVRGGGKSEMEVKG